MAGKTDKKLKKNDLWYCLLLVTLFIVGIAFFSRDLVTYQFNPGLIDRYMRSQDIPYDVPGRLFLSDSDIHIAAGYLYINGNDPTEYNFQHPPMIKYLYGAAIQLTGNPFWVQFLFSIALILLTYAIGRIFFRSALAGFVAGLLMLIDPLFFHVSTQALLDLGQTVFLTAFLLVAIRYPEKRIVQGLLLGCAAVSKFFSPILFFWFAAFVYLWYRDKKLPVVHTLIVGAVAFVVVHLVYAVTMVNQGIFSPVFFQLKMLKYWFHHSVSSFPGANILLFLIGFYKPWWGDQSIEFSKIWSVAWPLSVVVAIRELWIGVLKKFTPEKLQMLFVYLFPLFYLTSLAIQAPFVRYFIALLPWLYAGLAWSVVIFLKRKTKNDIIA